LTFISSTVLVKLGIFPLVRLQVLAGRKLTGASPELGFLFQLLKVRLKSLGLHQILDRIKVILIFLKGVKANFVLHNISAISMFIYPLLNFGMFVTFIYSLRGMMFGDLKPELKQGGALWFKDLTSKDTSLILPSLSVAISYFSIRYTFTGAIGRLPIFFKDIFQSLLILSYPIIMTLPSGIFLYWIPSTLFAMCQTYALRSSYILKFLKIPPIVRPAHLQPPTKL